MFNLFWVTMMDKKLITRIMYATLLVSGLVATLPSRAQHHAGAPHSAPPGAYHGDGRYDHDGRLWWGLGLGLGLGWDAYYGYPYYWYDYPPYYYAPPATVLVPSSPTPPANWFYCDSLKNYYPYVDKCPEQWRVVPATPPAAQPASPPPAAR